LARTDFGKPVLVKPDFTSRIRKNLIFFKADLTNPGKAA
jgi:hypothetical protein